MEKTINDRLLFFIQQNGLNVNSFSKAIGVNPAIIHNMVKGRRTNPSYEILKKIGLSFDNIDFNWLITGKSRNYLVLEEPEGKYDTKTVSNEKSVNEKMEELRKMVDKMSNEMKELKGKLD